MSQANILLIMTDQHRLSGVGAYGPTPCQTPNLDALAADGARFDQAYCPTAICSPARASLLTGLLPHRHGVTANIGDLGCNQSFIADHPDLLSRRLQSAGYACGYTGKWHLCAEEHKRTRYQADYIMSLPSTLGFKGHDFHGHGGGGFGYADYQRYLQKHGWQHEVETVPAAFGHEAGIVQGPVESTVPYFLTEHSIDLMKEFSGQQQPWFIWHNFWGPHEPYFVPQSYYDLYKDVSIDAWPDFSWDANQVLGPHRRWLVSPQPDWSYWEGLLRYYYAFASLIDAQVGRMVTYLRDSGQLDNTYIVFTADHGESLGAHGGLANKGVQAFEETLKVPLIIAGPDVKSGSVFQELVSHMDLHATVCAWAGAEPVADTNALDLGALLGGQAQSWRDAWVCESHGVSGFLCTQRVLRWGKWSYCWSGGFPELLFNLEDDPHQQHNLANDVEAQASLQQCRQRLLAWMDEQRDQSKPAFTQDLSLLAATD